MPPKKKDALLAAFLNIFFPGAGYFYLKRPIGGCIDGFLMLIAMANCLTGSSGEGMGLYIVLAFTGAIHSVIVVRRANAKIDEQADAMMMTCPNCAERIQGAAKICRFCQREVFASR